MLTRLVRISLLAVLATGLLGGTAHAVAGDMYASPIVIPAAGGSSTTPVTGAFIEPGENPGLPGDTPWDWTVWYAWTMPSAALTDVPVRADLCGPDLASEPGFITKLSYREAAVGIGGTALASTQTGCPPKGGPYTVARISFTASPGTDYRFAAGSGPTALGSLTFTLATAPYATVAPTESGVTNVGATLTAAAATWTLAGGIVDPPTWHRCNKEGGSCNAIAGATTSTYLLQAADIGSTIRVQYSAQNGIGATAIASLQSTVVSAVSVVSPPPPPTPATDLDTDGDGVANTTDTDDDNDGLLDVVEIAYGYNPLKADTDDDGRSDRDDACRTFGVCGNVTIGAGGRVLIVSDNGAKTGTRTITGTSGNNSIFNTMGIQDLSSIAQALSLICNGAGGNDQCFGGPAIDICVAGKGSDTCIGNGGADSCISTTGKDTCSGGAGNNSCTAKLSLNDKLKSLGFDRGPVVGCDGGAGNDTCTTTISPPLGSAISNPSKFYAYLQTLPPISAKCAGGSGSDMCKVAPRSWDPITGVDGIFGQLSLLKALAAAPKLNTTCIGGPGNDTCVAADAMSWTIGYIGAVGATTTCNGGPGSDLLLTANGKAGDVIIGGTGDVCYADKGDRVAGCSKTVQFDGLVTIARLQQGATHYQSVGTLLSGIGSVIAGNQSFSNLKAEAEAEKLRATIDSVQLQEKDMLHMLDLIHDVQQKLVAITQSQTEAMRTIMRDV